MTPVEIFTLAFVLNHAAGAPRRRAWFWLRRKMSNLVFKEVR